MRIAILGGSFDPIHLGHLQIAKTALKKLAIDEVWFMPTFSTPLKQGQQASFADRCFMIKRAIYGYRRMKVCTLEQQLGGTSYTIAVSYTHLDVYKRQAMKPCWRLFAMVMRKHLSNS